MRFRAPVGSDDFAQLRRERLEYVDKTRLVAELVADTSRVVLLPRPRRFGKTTNLSMLRYFFEWTPNGPDRAPLFEDLAVWGEPEARAHFAAHPVLALTLKELKAASWERCQADLASLVAQLYGQHGWLLEHPSMSAPDRELFRALWTGEAGPTAIERALLTLSSWLHRATGREVVILIDEYDTPIHLGWLGGWYREIVDFFRVFLGAALKGNPALWKGVLTGILRISKESIFSDINNLAVYTVTRARYSDAFGFTAPEVQALAARAGAPESVPELRRWYNGYRFGQTTIYNPWSVMSFLASEDRQPRPYWVNTSSNELVGRLITRGSEQLSHDLETLLAGGRVRKRIDEGLILPDLDERTDAIWSLLLWSGYLKATALHRGGLEATLAVPNREVMLAYDLLLQRWMERAAGDSAEIAVMLRAMLAGETDRFEDGLSRLVCTALSFHDVGGRDPERVYHAFVLGLLVQLRATHKVQSNRESGLGRADVLVLPRRPGRAGAVLEFKRVRDGDSPEAALASALDQIQARAYATVVTEAGASAVHCYGVVFDGKAVRVRRA